MSVGISYFSGLAFSRNWQHFMVRDIKIDSRRHFTTILCENVVVMKTSPRNVGELVFFGIPEGLSYHHSKQLRQRFVAHKE